MPPPPCCSLPGPGIQPGRARDSVAGQPASPSLRASPPRPACRPGCLIVAGAEQATGPVSGLGAVGAGTVLPGGAGESARPSMALVAKSAGTPRLRLVIIRSWLRIAPPETGDLDGQETGGLGVPAVRVPAGTGGAAAGCVVPAAGGRRARELVLQPGSAPGPRWAAPPGPARRVCDPARGRAGAATSELTALILSGEARQPHQLIAEHAAMAAGADFAVLAVPDGTSQVTVTAAAGLAAGRTAPLNDSLAGLGGPHRQAVPGHPLRRGRSRARCTGQRAGPLMIVPLAAGDEVVGALIVGRLAGSPGFTDASLDMAASFAAHAAVSAELAQARAQQIALARIEDHERIAGDLHDSVIQELFALGMGLQSLAGRTSTSAHAEQLEAVTSIPSTRSSARSATASSSSSHARRRPPASGPDPGSHRRARPSARLYRRNRIRRAPRRGRRPGTSPRHRRRYPRGPVQLRAARWRYHRRHFPGPGRPRDHSGGHRQRPRYRHACPLQRRPACATAPSVTAAP